MKQDVINISDETKERLITLISADIAKHVSEIKRLEKDIAVLRNQNDAYGNRDHISVSSSKKTFKEFVKDLLSDGRPRTSREMLNIFVKERGKDMSMPAFSSQLSPMVHKDKLIKIHEEPKNPIETRNYYGLVSWFSGDRLKSEYYAKIKE